jgi:carbamoyl-phosphate synthase large subunit
MDNTEIRLLITAVGGGSIGEQIYKAVGMSPRPIWVASANTSASAQEIVEAQAHIVLPKATDPDYLPALARAIQTHRINYLVAGSEIELKQIANNPAVLADLGCTLLANNAEAINLCLDKEKFVAAMNDLGFRVPLTHVPKNREDIVLPGGKFPVVIKPARGGSGSAMTFIAQNHGELEFFQNYLFDYGYTPMIQEYVGNAESEYTVGVLHFPDGTLNSVVCLKRDILSGLSNKLRIPNASENADCGEVLAVSSGVTQGEIVDMPQVSAAAVRIAEALGSTGPMNVQGRWDSKDFVVFEVNPRYSGTTPMRALAGVNEPLLTLSWYNKSAPAEQGMITGGVFHRSLKEHFQASGSSIAPIPDQTVS